MNLTVKTLSALALAAAAFAATTGSSSALVRDQFAPGAFKQLLPSSGSPFHIPPRLGSGIGGHGISCLACNLPHPNPPTGGSGKPAHGDGWHHGFGWNDWRYRFGRPEVIVEGGPVVAGATPVAMQTSAPAPQQTAAEPCNCLTKQEMPDGSVLFQDICTKQSAIAPPVTVGSR